MFRSLLILMLFCAANAGRCEDAAAPKRAFPQMPPKGIAIPEGIKSELNQGVRDLGWEIEHLRTELSARPDLLKLLPDVQIYHNAVRYALEDEIFYKTNDFASARKLLEEGRERARLLREGKAPWTTATGLVVRGYKSRLDDSVQPYGLVVPASYRAGSTNRHRLDFWFHGRNNNLSELSFITDREKNPGEFTPTNTFVLHPYGRYCNANKFAGEVDAFEALENVRGQYPIDENRVSVRGFSMGGASTWHLATQHPGLWAAASPGAGFVDTAIFQKIFSRTNQLPPPWYEQKLWHLYDSLDYAANLYNCPVVAYSGEIDGQRQAAELMTIAMRKEGLELVHIIGPNTAHKYEPKAKAEVARRVDALAEKGRDPLPKKVRFTTWTLRYNQSAWVTVDGLEQHWSRARVEAEIAGPDRINVATTNVTALTLSMPAGLCPLAGDRPPKVVLDSQVLEARAVKRDRSWTAKFRKSGSGWSLASAGDDQALRKQHGLQGPIDDAFMDSFIMVRPTGKALNARVDGWTRDAMAQAITEWRLQFRGEPRVKDDVEITPEEMAANNLVLWGDPRSNQLLARLAAKLPILWNNRGVQLLGKSLDAEKFVPVLIYPNPLNPKRYVVVNSGFTFADAAPTSNALQVPKLPDYAVLQLDSSKVVEAGFFDEDWRMPLIPKP